MMPPLKRRRAASRNAWTRDHICQLMSGYDFFNGGWGSPECLPWLPRENWPGETALAEMLECWHAHRDEMLDDADYKDARPFWIELVEQGMDPIDAIDEHHRLSRERRDKRG